MQNSLHRYLKQPGQSMAALAARVGVFPSTITRPLKGERQPSIELAKEIERKTNGEITARDFIAACLEAQEEAA